MIYVVGDVMLDEYLYGEYVKENPEIKGGRVVRMRDERVALAGGAAAVAAMLRARSNVTVRLCGAVGDDDAGTELCDLVRAMDIQFDPFTGPLRTTVKSRLVVDGALSGERRDTECVLELSPYVPTDDIPHAVIVQDLGKGFVDKWHYNPHCTFVDPYEHCDWRDKYRDVLCIKCNAKEASSQLKYVPDARPECIQDVSRVLREHLSVAALVMTCGHRGAYLCTRSGVDYFPARETTALDVCGAGDAFMAALVVSWLDGRTWSEAVRVAVEAGTRQCETIGTDVH